jgi:hypothetical protein
MSAFGLAWPKVTIAAFLLMAPLGALTARRIRAIRRANADAQAFNSELLQRLQDPILKISLGIRIGVFLGIVLLMVAKPELWESVSIVGASATFLGSFHPVSPGGGVVRCRLLVQTLKTKPTNSCTRNRTHQQTARTICGDTLMIGRRH